jgi:hypothetical protein
VKVEFVESDRKTRLRILGLVGVLVLLISLEHLTTPTATDPGQAFKRSADRLLISALIATPFFVCASIYFFCLGIKIKRAGQWPPPGLRVAVRTQVRRGQYAKWAAISMFVVAGLSIAQPLIFISVWHFSWRLAAELSRPHTESQPTLRNGSAGRRR